ncbi:MAG: glutamate synthase-related protein, partial [Acidimicrobiia bacterium]
MSQPENGRPERAGRGRSHRQIAELDSCGIGFVTHTSGEPSREIVELALTGLACVKHRGAIAADGLSGDGAGILVPIPRPFFARVAEAAGRELPTERLGVVNAYLDHDDVAARNAAEAAVAEACTAEGLELVAWRDVPIDTTQIGDSARADLPAMRQAFLVRPAGIEVAEAERSAYRARRAAEAACRDADVRAYFASWSFTTVTYKALVISDRLAAFYPDLAADDFAAPLAIFHSRFSTNTMPAWERAQPFRLLCHNGEINTVEGNENRMVARGVLGTEAAGLGPEEQFRPLFDPHDSDSGKLDVAIELLMRGGRDVRHAIAMTVPEAWEGQRDLAPGVRDFFRYHACLSDPWDGPAGLVFTDGRRIGAALDRNGLRPMRWLACEDGLVVCASETGAVPIEGHGTVRRGRLGPGEMLCVDPDAGGIQGDDTLKRWLAGRAPYAAWAADGLRPFSSGKPLDETPEADALLAHQGVYGVTKEEVAMVLKPMAADAKEPTFSMGDDIPFATASSRPRLVFNALKQRFAQVSNPPIDHLRERLVMSLRTCLGPRRPLLSEGPEVARLLEIPTFFLYPSAVATLLDPALSPFATARLDATFPVGEGPAGLRRALERLADDAERAVDVGTGVLVVSDAGVDATRAAIPSLLATGVVHHRLVRVHRRQNVALVIDSGDARDTHAVAALLGYGADAICPRLALETVAALADDGQLGELHAAEAQAKLQAALEDGVLKIFSKMGISTVDGYRAAQIFEALGLAPEVIDLCLAGTTSTVGGIGFSELGADAIARHGAGYLVDDVVLDEPGLIRFRKRGGEYHANNPEVFEALHGVSGVAGSDESTGVKKLETVPLAPARDQGRVMFLESAAQVPPPPPAPDPVDVRAAHVLQRAIGEGRGDLYRTFADLVERRPVVELNDLLEFAPTGTIVPIEEVEPASDITRRFSTGAMSHGSLSREAHETLAMAMNLIGGKSNCGEGGEDPYRYRTRGSAQDKNSRIKQIASGRFGVTPEYCMFADELNIKMAQGSKPGEGGQLPGHKVSAEIARLRHTQPGVGLISPPPHHDIYSIEDLAQLIYDLKQVNPAADVSVKLVAEAGVGTIAAGVVKALADIVQISGANGGTGASPLSSIKNAGLPWELGLAEAQQTLIDNGLRDRVKLRVDGGFKTGR